MKTVHELRNEGFKVMVYVDRLPYDAGKIMTEDARNGHLVTHQEIEDICQPVVSLRKLDAKKKMWGHGGVTRMQVWIPERKDEDGASPDYEVKAVCSVLDQFNKRTGHQICLGRLDIVLAGQSYEWPREYQQRG